MLVLVLLAAVSGASAVVQPCGEIHAELRLPCRCEVDVASDGIHMDCDEVVFARTLPVFPLRAPIVSFTHRNVGHQTLPTQAFTAADLPLNKIDFSGNLLRRLTDRLFLGLHNTLEVLLLSDNLLGDNLNPIFSTSEFHDLEQLRVLDLSGNLIKGVEEGLLKGCVNLQTLLLSRNSITSVPSASLNGPRALKILSLKENRISSIGVGAFQAQKLLDSIDLSSNLLTSLEGGSLSGLSKLRSLNLRHNRFSRFNSDVFQGVENLDTLDLAENFILEFPTIALKFFVHLKHLNLSSNLIQNLEGASLASHGYLETLDLSRNSIAAILPGTFVGLRKLRRLDLSVNSLRTLEEDVFDGLDHLESLSIRDNNILLVPASSLARMPGLTHVDLGFNRVAALSGQLLQAVSGQIKALDLQRNVVGELPPNTFIQFDSLEKLNLGGNLLSSFTAHTFSGLEDSLKELILRNNQITSLTGLPIVLPNLKILDLSRNRMKEMSANAFTNVQSVTHLNLSRNSLGTLSSKLLHQMPRLKFLDLSFIELKVLAPELLAKSHELEIVNLRGNFLQEIPEGSFTNLRNLTTVDISNNHILNIRPAAFINVVSIRKIVLHSNMLSAFKGEMFKLTGPGTSLQELDLSRNEISYLFPSAFRVHPKLRRLNVSHNRFNFFPAELLTSLQYLEAVDLSNNTLTSVEELDFARLPRLRNLNLAKNKIETVGESAFHNSSQLQLLDLSDNLIGRLGERTFEGLARLAYLNLEGNFLADLPESIFERSKLQMLENINLARNRFVIAPLKTLQRQYFFLSSVNLSRNAINQIPSEDSIMVNIKKLDLSFNPLSAEAIANVLGEPKTVRELNLAGTGITEVRTLETPFLRYLNLSGNSIRQIPSDVLARTTLLEDLDVSANKLTELLPNVWPLLPSLRNVDLSSNPIEVISKGDLDGLTMLHSLKLRHLNACTRVEKDAFESVVNLERFEAYGYPRLGYLDVRGILHHMPGLESLEVEVKDAAVGGDVLGPALQPRLKELGIRGDRIKTISSGALVGLRAPQLSIALRQTGLTSLPQALLFPVPRSTKIQLDVSGSTLANLSRQLLATLDERRGDVTLVGLEQNPISCDCGARALRRWLPGAGMTGIHCSSPPHLAGKLLVEIGDDELVCGAAKTSPPNTTQAPPRPSIRPPLRVTTEPDIILASPSPTKEKSPGNKIAAVSPSGIGNDDTLIISIVGGVVAFIAILFIVICIVRLRITNSQYSGGPLASPGALQSPSPSCTCVKPSMVMMPPFAPNCATLQPKMMPIPPSTSPSLRPHYSMVAQPNYYQTSPY